MVLSFVPTKRGEKKFYCYTTQTDMFPTPNSIKNYELRITNHGRESIDGVCFTSDYRLTAREVRRVGERNGHIDA